MVTWFFVSWSLILSSACCSWLVSFSLSASCLFLVKSNKCLCCFCTDNSSAPCVRCLFSNSLYACFMRRSRVCNVRKSSPYDLITSGSWACVPSYLDKAFSSRRSTIFKIRFSVIKLLIQTHVYLHYARAENYYFLFVSLQ